MRVLEAFGEPISDGGQEAFVFGVMDKMDMIDLQIDCLTAYDCRSEKYRFLVEKLGGKVYTLNLPFTPGKSRGNIRKPFRRFLMGHHYDIVHIHSGSISVLTIMAEVADKAGVNKVIVHSHCTGDKDDFKHKILRKMASISMKKHVDVFCACSQAAADWKFESRVLPQAIIIKNGIDVDKFFFNAEKRRYWREKLGYKDELVIGHVGRFSYQKNQAFLVEIFNKLLERRPGSRLLLVGDGEDKKSVEQLVRDKGLVEKVTFTGSVNNVEDYLQAMDVFVLPSRFEGLPIVAVEAMSTGLMAVISDHVPSDGLSQDRIHIIPLSADTDIWVNAVIASTVRERIDQSVLVHQSIFDIKYSVDQVRRLYS